VRLTRVGRLIRSNDRVVREPEIVRKYSVKKPRLRQKAAVRFVVIRDVKDGNTMAGGIEAGEARS